MPKTPLAGLSGEWLIPILILVCIAIFLFNSYRLGKLHINLNFRTQLIASIVIIVVSNIITEIAKHWIFRSAGFVLCGLLYIIHPVLPKGAENSKRTLLGVRLAGLILMLIGVFTRLYL